MMRTTSIWLDRLLPARLRRRKALEDEELLALWSRVTDDDRCLAAVMELLSRQLEWNFQQSGAMTLDPATRQECALNAHLAAGLMAEIERWRERSKQWLADRSRMETGGRGRR